MLADPYHELLAEYVVELRAARHDVLAWWGQLREREVRVWGDERLAEQALRMRWPLGPVAHPRVIAVYRKYYLAIAELNRQRTDDEDAPFDADPLDETAWNDDVDDDVLVQHPRAVLYERLDEIDPDLARFMDPFVFVPIGADREGRLV